MTVAVSGYSLMLERAVCKAVCNGVTALSHSVRDVGGVGRSGLEPDVFITVSVRLNVSPECVLLRVTCCCELSLPSDTTMTLEESTAIGRVTVPVAARRRRSLDRKRDRD